MSTQASTAPQAASPAYLSTFQTVSDQLHAAIGHRLFTVSRILPNGIEVERIFTNMPEAYPVHGTKLMDQTAWTAAMARGECFVASDPADFGEHFGDLDTIVSLGLGAVINVPIHAAGRLMGTLNLLDKTGSYRGDVFTACHKAQALAIQGYTEYEQFLEQLPAK